MHIPSSSMSRSASSVVHDLVVVDVAHSQCVHDVLDADVIPSQRVVHWLASAVRVLQQKVHALERLDRCDVPHDVSQGVCAPNVHDGRVRLCLDELVVPSVLGLSSVRVEDRPFSRAGPVVRVNRWQRRFSEDKSAMTEVEGICSMSASIEVDGITSTSARPDVEDICGPCPIASCSGSVYGFTSVLASAPSLAKFPRCRRSRRGSPVNCVPAASSVQVPLDIAELVDHGFGQEAKRLLTACDAQGLPDFCNSPGDDSDAQGPCAHLGIRPDDMYVESSISLLVDPVLLEVQVSVVDNVVQGVESKSPVEFFCIASDSDLTEYDHECSGADGAYMPVIDDIAVSADANRLAAFAHCCPSAHLGISPDDLYDVLCGDIALSYCLRDCISSRAYGGSLDGGQRIHSCSCSLCTLAAGICSGIHEELEVAREQSVELAGCGESFVRELILDLAVRICGFVFRLPSDQAPGFLSNMSRLLAQVLPKFCREFRGLKGSSAAARYYIETLDLLSSPFSCRGCALLGP